jgi:hypothetical protein
MNIKKIIGLLIVLLVSCSLIATNNIIFLESQKSWLAEVLFSENYKFLNFTFGPLYLMYLKILRVIFEYPNFIKAELYISSTIFLIFFYKFLRIHFDQFESFLISLTFVPLILLIESRQNLLGSAFIILYLIKISKKETISSLPISLLISSLLTRTFIPLLLIHFITSILLNQKKIFNKNLFHIKINYLKIILFVIFITSLNFQLKDKINNHMLYDPTYAPDINYNNPIEVGFFQFNNQKLSNDKKIEKEDWYFTFKKNYNDNNSLYKLIINDPAIVIKHICNNILPLIYQINEIIFSKWFRKIDLSFQILLSFINLFLICKSLLIFYKKKNNIIYIPTLIYLGIFFFSILLVNSTWRYIILLLPIYTLLFYVSLKKILNKNFKIYLTIFSIFSFYNNYFYYINFTKINFKETKGLEVYLKNLEPNKIIFTNEKSLLSIINKKGKVYLGFDSVPPYYDKKTYDHLKQVDIIIFTEDAKLYDEISRKQGDRYLLYIKPYLENKNWENIKIDNFNILTNKNKF